MVPEVNAPEVQVGMPGTHCCLKPSSHPGTWWVFENRHESTEAETCTSQFSSYHWQRLSPGIRSQKTRVENYGEVGTFC